MTLPKHLNYQVKRCLNCVLKSNDDDCVCLCDNDDNNDDEGYNTHDDNV